MCGGCMAVVRREFTRKNLNFDADTSHGRIDWVEVFGAGSNRLFTGWRSFFAVRLLLASTCFFVFGFSWYDWVETDGRGAEYWFLYLTHWTLSLECAYFALALVTSAKSRGWRAEDGQSTGIPWYCRGMWFLQSVTLPGALIVVLMYWTLVYGGGSVAAITPLTHGLNFVLIFVDVLISAQPYFLAHGVYYLGYSVLYFAWSAVHYAADIGRNDGERYIYSSLDWSNAGKTSMLGFFLIFLVAPILVLVLFCLLTAARGITAPVANSPATNKSLQDLAL